MEGQGGGLHAAGRGAFQMTNAEIRMGRKRGLKPVRAEEAGIGGNKGGVFAEADVGGFAADDPVADDGMITGEV